MSISQRYEPDFSQVIRARGEHYFRDGRVRVLRQDVDVIEAEVQCSEPYRVQLAFEGDRLDAECGCTYFRDHGACKHVWAVLRELDEGGTHPVESTAVSREPEPELPAASESAPDPAPGTVNPAPERSAPAPEPAVDGAGAFSYLLDLDRARARGLPSVQILEPTGTGRFAPRRVGRAEVRELTVDSDRRLLGHLFRLGLDADEETTPYPTASSLVECSAFPLRDPDLPALFALLCATGRFHLRRAGQVSKPVSWDSTAEHALGFGFVLADDPGDDGGHLWRLVAFLEDDRERIAFADADVVLEGVVIQGERALAYDPGSHYARVEKTLAPNTPPLAQKERDRIVARLLSAEDGPRVDLPAEWLRGATDVPPRPVLSIVGGGRDFAAAAADPAHEVVCGLAFERDGHRWPAGSSAREVCDLRQRVVWARDPALEEQAEARLAVLGAWPDPDDRCLWRLRGGTLEAAVQALAAEGWEVELRERPYRGEGQLRLRVSSGVDWFELEGDLEIDGDRLPLAAVLEAARRRERTVDLPDGSTGTIPGNWVERLALLSSMAQSTRGKSAGAGPLRFQRTQGWLLDTLLEDQTVDVDAEFRKYRESLETFRGIEPVDPPATFEGTLRSYQQDALGWFDFLHKFGFGGCLADDMGLGKTVQVLAMLEADRTAGRRGPSLVAAPRSVVYNWVEEARRFVPGLRAVEYGGEYREGDIANLGELDLIVISYGLLRRDITRLKEVSFRHVILDEAQAIKNSASQTAKCARLLRGEHRLALSGTPLENHLGELWSIFEFLNPGMLGRDSGFRRVFTSRNPEPHECALLASALRPFLLRRTKDQVEKELPEKTEQTLLCDMLPSQQALYDNLARHYRATLLGRVEEEGIRSTRMPILEALLRLRQVACHPALVDKDSADDASGKLEWLVPQLEEIVEEGHKALVFSQFTSFLAIVQRRLEAAGIPFEYLDGSTRNRRARVARFQTDAKCPVFLISLKAGGLGLNLTAADYVFILDPWWNPAVEAQAIDRTHRIGQTRRVFAYRAIARGTVEEKILELQHRKRALADSIIRADGSLLSSLTREDLELLLTAPPGS